MKNLFLAIICVLFTSSMFAQISISAVYSNLNASGWDEIMSAEGVNAYDNGYIIGLDYWFRLKDYRVEFLPDFQMAGPGISLFRYDDIIFRQPFENPILQETNTTRFTMAAGLGLDIGVTKAITITPFGRFKWYAPGSWDGLEALALVNGTQDQYNDCITLS